MVLREWAADEIAAVDDVRSALRRLSAAPVDAAAATLDDADWIALLGADAAELDELCALADAARREVIGADTLTFVVNRNLDTSVIWSLPDSGPTLEDLVAEARDLGATEICLQGAIPEDAPADGYLRIIERIHAAAPEIHLHAFRQPEIADAASRMGIGVGDFLARARAAGLGSVPGTAAQILDDDVRAHLSGGRLPSVADWVAGIEAAHVAGLFSTATLLYGHVETPAQVIAHLRLLNEIQDRTGGCTELIVMPMVPGYAPPHLARTATTTASMRETRAVHAVARLLTRGRFAHVQVAWSKLDADSVTAVLEGGVDDIGGLLIDGELMPEAGQEAGSVLGVEDLVDIAVRSGRELRQRTTGYQTPPDAALLRIPQARS